MAVFNVLDNFNVSSINASNAPKRDEHRAYSGNRTHKRKQTPCEYVRKYSDFTSILFWLGFFIESLNMNAAAKF